MMPSVSIVVRAHNAAERLPYTLKHLVAQRPLHGIAWEVVLVDNASTDRTAEVARRCWSDGHAPLRVVHEARPGAAHAWQRGLEEARYEIVSFVDDDNWICEDWVSSVSQIMNQHPEVGACGGFSEAVCAITPPSWFESYKSFYAIGPFFSGEGDITEQIGMLWGAGMSIRRSAWLQLRENGYQCLSTLWGECHELSLVLRIAGWRLWLDRRLSLKHFMPAGRLTWNYFRQLQRIRNLYLVVVDPYYFALASAAGNSIDASRRRWNYQFALVCRNLCQNLLLRPHKFLGRSSPRFEGDQDVVRIETYTGRFLGLLHYRKQYDANVRAVESARWRKCAVKSSISIPPEVAHCD